jgi:hypothetical protein
MGTGLKSGNEVTLLFASELEDARSVFDIKEILHELRRDLAMKKRPLRIMRHIPGCYVEFASGALHGSIIFSNGKAPSRSFDVQMILGCGKMTQTKRRLVQEHQSHISISVTVETEDGEKRPQANAQEVLKRLAQSASARLANLDATVMYWGPSVETYNKLEFGAFFASDSLMPPSIALSPLPQPTPRPEVAETRPRFSNDQDRMEQLADQMRTKSLLEETPSLKEVVAQSWSMTMGMANSSYGKIAAGLALGVILHATFSDAVIVERAMADTADQTIIVAAE